MAGEDLVRVVPILTVRETAPVVAFWARLGLRVTAEFDGYVILATEPLRGDDAVEVHLSQWDDHDPRTTANIGVIDPAGTLVRVGSWPAS